MQRLATAREDRELLRELMAMPAPDRIAAAAGEPRFHRRTLARLLALEVESALGDPPADARERAELGAAIAGALPRDPGGEAQRMAAWAYWLLGKTLLRGWQWRLAEEAFRGISAFIPQVGASEAEALACLGFAQLEEDLGREDKAVAMFLRAAYLYSSRRAEGAEAACQAQLGLLLHRGGDLESARGPLRAALRRFDEALAPSLAARLRLALAGIETVLGRPAIAARELARARALYPLAPSAAEAVKRLWSEARIAAVAGEGELAETLLERVRRELLAHGSVIEAARCSREQLLLQVERRRYGAARELARELAQAFGPAASPWAEDLAKLARLAAEDPGEVYRASCELELRLDRREVPAAGRPALLVPSRALADRLLCGCGELEDPVGSAAGL